MNRKSAARPISQAAKADPLAFLQREQWSKPKRSVLPVSSNCMSPQRQLPCKTEFMPIRYRVTERTPNTYKISEPAKIPHHQDQPDSRNPANSLDRAEVAR